jgi:hypothetical protein
MSWNAYRLFIGTLWVASAATLPAQIIVGPNVQVSLPNKARHHYEVLAAADPTNGARMVVGSMVYDGAAQDATVVYTTADGGATWKQTLYRGGGDPMCAFGGDGTAYFGMAVEVPNHFEDVYKDRTVVYRSRDGGITWSEGASIPFIDRAYLVVDQTNGRNRGSLYLNGTVDFPYTDAPVGISGLGLYSSRDSGRTFAHPVHRMVRPPGHTLGMANTVILSDGMLVTLFGYLKQYNVLEGFRANSAGPNSQLVVARSRDGGRSLDMVIPVSDWAQPNGATQQSVVSPTLAVDPGSAPFKDRLYAVWTDERNGRLDVLMAYSADRGIRWSQPKMLNDRLGNSVVANTGAFLPVAAVNKSGIVVVGWYDQSDEPNYAGWRYRIRASFDGGDTWTPSVPVSSEPAKLDMQASFPIEPYVFGRRSQTTDSANPRGGTITVPVATNHFLTSAGHTGAIVVDANGVFHPFWYDNRTGTSQLWTAPVTVKGQVVRNGTPDLATFEDITSTLEVALDSMRYDPAAKTISVDLRLYNRGPETVHGKIGARLFNVRSVLGEVALENSDRSAGQGAYYIDLTSHLPASGLPAKTPSTPRKLIFRTTAAAETKRAEVRRQPLLQFDARILRAR